MHERSLQCAQPNNIFVPSTSSCCDHTACYKRASEYQSYLTANVSAHSDRDCEKQRDILAPTVSSLNMATLQHLKRALRQEQVPQTSLINDQYAVGFKIISESTGYGNFIVPQLSRLLSERRPQLSILEIGPGLESVLASLYVHIRRRVSRYTAYESNGVFARAWSERLASDDVSVFPCLEDRPVVHSLEFDLETNLYDENYDLVLFCYSPYGMKPVRKYVEYALHFLPEDGVVMVFHRDGVLDLDGLVCDQISTLPNGSVQVADEDELLDSLPASYLEAL